MAVSRDLMASSPDHPYEYIVVGSGAGGGTLAARLAEAGRRVLLLEAGGDPRELEGGDPIDPKSSRLPADYDVPAFHPFASENEALCWSFFVRHHADRTLDQCDPKYVSRVGDREVDGMFYPRAGTLGGCTAHNAMIFVYPHNADWDYIAAVTGDRTWSARAMRRYFERLENCHHRPVYRWPARLGINPTRHGWGGWLPTEAAIPLEALTDRRLRRVVIQSAIEAFRAAGNPRQRLRWLLRGQFDPNDWRLVAENVGRVKKPRRSAWGKNGDHTSGVGLRNLRPAARAPSHSGRFRRVPRWHGARLLLSSGRALDELRTAVSRAECALPDRARSLRDLSRAGRQPARRGRDTPLRRAGRLRAERYGAPRRSLGGGGSSGTFFSVAGSRAGLRGFAAATAASTGSSPFRVRAPCVRVAAAAEWPNERPTCSITCSPTCPCGNGS